MPDELIKVQDVQRYIIRKQANLIDEMFVLLCNYMAMEDLEPLLNSIKEVAEREEQ